MPAIPFGLEARNAPFAYKPKLGNMKPAKLPRNRYWKICLLNNQPKGLSCFRRSSSRDRGKWNLILCPLSLCGESTEKYCKIRLSSLSLSRRKRWISSSISFTLVWCQLSSVPCGAHLQTWSSNFPLIPRLKQSWSETSGSHSPTRAICHGAGRPSIKWWNTLSMCF